MLGIQIGHAGRKAATTAAVHWTLKRALGSPSARPRSSYPGDWGAPEP